MKTFNLFATGIAMTLMTACSPSVKVDSLPLSPSNKAWPDYAEQTLSGKVFGQDWKALTAIVKPFGTDKSQVSLEFYPEVKAKACTTSLFSSKPYATVVIPAAYTQTEYVVDMNAPGTGNPMMFSMMDGEARNIMATKTKIRVNSITATGLVASVYAQGTDTDGSVSEINGSVTITDCAKAVDFSVWDELAGWYNLQSFDGQYVQQRTAIVEYDSGRFYNRDNKSYIKTMVFPLFASVGTNTDMVYNFGPMEGLGATTVSVDKYGAKVYTYSYSGPITVKGTDATMTLDMTVVKADNSLNVTYTLEVPSYVTKTSHKFTISK